VSALWGLLRKEVLHILRDRRTLTVLVLLPVVQVILFGYSIRTDVRDVRLVVVDPMPDATTLALRERFEASGVFRVVAALPSSAGLDRLFRTDTAQVAIEFEPRFAERIARGETTRLLVISDASDPNSGAARQSYVNAVVQQYQSEELHQRAGIRIDIVARARFNPTQASANLFVPGLMALVLNIISALMTALSLTREKEAGTLEALLVSPL
jgi:ABC-2 type transport system permease protein